MGEIDSLRQIGNYLLAELLYAHRRTRLITSPISVNLELTNRCNLACSICGNPRMTRARGNMRFDLYRKIIDDIIAMGSVKIVSLVQCGESLLHPEFSEMLAYSSGKGFETRLSTNATLLRGRLAEEIIHNGLDELTISFDGYKPATYERVRKGACFDEVKRNIYDFLALRERMFSRKPRVIIQIITTEQTRDEIEAYCDEWRRTALNSVVIKPLNFFGDQLETAASQSQSLGFHPRQPLRYPCKVLWTGLIVLWDGTVVPCCVDFDAKLPLGDLRKSSLRDVWNNKFFVTLRSMHAAGKFDISICKSCRDWSGGKRNYLFPLDKDLCVNILNFSMKRILKRVYRIHICGQ